MRVNHRIRAREVRVIGPDGAQLGVMETRRALDIANQHGLDLAEVSPTSKPPVCKILDYGKHKYQLKKKAKAAKKNQVRTELKEIQFRPQTDIHDIDFKVKHITRFLGEANKVKVAVRFRGREMAHRDLGHSLLQQIIDKVGASGMVEQSPKMEGRILSMIFAPAKPGAKTKVGTKIAKPAKPSKKTSGETKVPIVARKAKTTAPTAKSDGR